MSELAAAIEHTRLAPGTTAPDVRSLVAEAIAHGLFGVCVPPAFVRDAVATRGPATLVIVTVIGFPFGYTTTAAKAGEASAAVADDADELDMVVPLGAIANGDWQTVAADVAGVVAVADGRPVKAILETAMWDAPTCAAAARAAIAGGAAFVKTSTGFGSGGATVAAVRTLRDAAGERVGVKASGGIRTAADARAMLAAGANRIGTSCGVALVAG